MMKYRKLSMINFYYDRVVDGIHIPNGIPEKFVKYYTPNFNDTKFRVEINMEPAVYPSDMRHTEYSSLKSVDTIKDDSFNVNFSLYKKSNLCLYKISVN